MKLNTINFHLTNKCNLMCRHCLYDSGKKMLKEMKTSDILRIINEFSKLSKNKGTVNLYGGETLLMKDIYKIIEEARKKGLEVGITTNVNVSKSRLEKLANLDVARITVDIDGGNSATHDWLRNKPGHFEQSKRAIKFFLSKNKYVSINSVLHNRNHKEVERILDLCIDLGISSISFYLFTPLGRGWEMKDSVLGPQEWFATKHRVSNWIRRNNPKFNIIWEKSYANKYEKKEKRLCEGFESQVLDVRCDGKVYFCGLLISVDGNSFGNLNEEKMEDVIKHRKNNGFKKETGCSALKIQNRFKFGVDKDMRKTWGNIVPVCPYDWEIMSGNKIKIHKKFVHVDDN